MHLACTGSQTVSRITAEPAWSVTSRTHMHAAWDRSRLTVEPAKKPGVLQVGHQAQDRSSLTVEPAKKPRSLPMKANSAPRGRNSAHV